MLTLCLPEYYGLVIFLSMLCMDAKGGGMKDGELEGCSRSACLGCEWPQGLGTGGAKRSRFFVM